MTKTAKTTGNLENTSPPNYTQQYHELMQQIQTTRQQISAFEKEANEKQAESNKQNFTSEIKTLSNEIQNLREIKQELDEELNEVRQKNTPEIKSDLDSEVSDLRREFFFATEGLESTRETISKKKLEKENFLSKEPAKSVVEAEKQVTELTHKLNDLYRESARIDVDFEETFNPSEDAPKKENRKLTFLKRKLQLIENEKEKKKQQIEQMAKDQEKAINQMHAKKEEEERKKKLRAELSKNRRRELIAQQRKAFGIEAETEAESGAQSPKTEKSINSAFDSILNDGSVPSSPRHSKRRRRKKTTENQEELENQPEPVEEATKKSKPSSPRKTKRKHNKEAEKQNELEKIADIGNNLLPNDNSIQCKLSQLIILDVSPESASKNETNGFSEPIICDIGDESHINPSICGSIQKTKNESESSLELSNQSFSKSEFDIEPSPDLMKLVSSNLNPLLNITSPDNQDENVNTENDQKESNETDKNEAVANEIDKNETNEIDKNETDKTDKNETNETDNADKNETNETDKNESTENITNEIDKSETNESNENKKKNVDKDENDANQNETQDNGGTHIMNDVEEDVKIVKVKKKEKKEIKKDFETTVVVDGFLREKSSDETVMKFDSLIILDINPTPLFEKLSVALKKKGISSEGKFDRL